MKHLENHTHAFLDGNNIVIGIYVFDDHDHDLLESVKNHLNAADVKCCCDYGIAYVGGDFYNGKFYPVKPYPSWIRDEEFEIWKAPIAYPEGGSTYSWDEDQLQWVEITE